MIDLMKLVSIIAWASVVGPSPIFTEDGFSIALKILKYQWASFLL